MKAHLLAGAAVIALAAAAPALAGKWQPHVDIIGKPGSDRHIGEVDLFVPMFQNSDTMLFLDLRGQGDDDENYEGNVGLGLRRMFNDSYILGGYAFFDARRTENDNTFYQGVVGFEALARNWDFRINGYIPEDEEKSADGLAKVKVTGNTIAVLPGIERALYGGDAEVGLRVPIGEDTRIYLGGYYFDSFDDDNDIERVAGPRGRLEIRLHDLGVMGARLTLGGEAQWDEPRGTQYFGVVRVRVPLGGGSGQALTALERRMVDPVVRDVDILAGLGLGDPEGALNPNISTRNGVHELIDGIFFAADDAGGPGTFVAPDDLTGALASAVAVDGTDGGDADAIVVALARYGDFDSQSAPLADGLILMGGGGSVKLIGAKSGQKATFTAPGATPTLTFSASPVVTLADDNIVTGLIVDNVSPGVGIYGFNVTGFDINNNTIRGNTTGIHIVTAGSFTTVGTIDDNLIDFNTVHGVYLHNYGGSTATQTVTLTGNTITSNTSDGVHITNVAVTQGAQSIQTVTLIGNTISGNTDDGVDIHNYASTGDAIALQTVIFRDNVIDSNDPGVEIDNNAYDGGVAVQKVYFTGDSITGSGGTGIDIENSASNSYTLATQMVTLTNVTITGNAGDGIDIDNGATSGGGAVAIQTLTITGSTISGNTAGHGVDARNHSYMGGHGGTVATQTVMIADSTITGNSAGGLLFANYANVDHSDGAATATQIVTLTGNTITGNLGDGVYIHQYVNNSHSHYGSAAGTQMVTLTDNIITGNTGDGVRAYNFVNASAEYLVPSATQILTLTGNTISFNTDDGLDLLNHADYGNAVQIVTLTDNTFEGNTDNGVELYNAATGYSATASQTVTLTDNSIITNGGVGLYIHNYSDAGDAFAAQIVDLSGGGNTISGNLAAYQVSIENSDSGGVASQFIDLSGPGNYIAGAPGSIDITGDDNQFVILPDGTIAP